MIILGYSGIPYTQRIKGTKTVSLGYYYHIFDPNFDL